MEEVPVPLSQILVIDLALEEVQVLLTSHKDQCILIILQMQERVDMIKKVLIVVEVRC